MVLNVVFAPRSQTQLADLLSYIAEDSSFEVAQRFVNGIITYCESLRTFPHRGQLRDDIRPGLRITGYKRSTTIAHFVDGDRVVILGVFYGGQDYEAVLLGPDPDIAES